MRTRIDRRRLILEDRGPVLILRIRRVHLQVSGAWPIQGSLINFVDVDADRVRVLHWQRLECLG